MNQETQPTEQKTSLPGMPASDQSSNVINTTPSPGPSFMDTPAPPPAVADKPHKKSGGMGKTVSILLVILLALGTAAAGYFYGKSKAPTKVVTQTTVAVVPPLTVPQGATVLSQCSAGKGTLYALPKDIPTGPVYMVNKNKVIGLEYMVGKDDLLVAGKSFLNLPMYGQKFDHVNIGLLSQGHAGFPIPHYHVDLYTVTPAVAEAVKCDTSSSSSSSTTTTPSTTTPSTTTPSTTTPTTTQ